MAEYLHQTDQPLFPKVLWNRPVSRAGAGKFLLIGGRAGHFNLINDVYSAAAAGGAGELKLALPDSLRGMVPADAAEFLPSSPSGSLGQEAITPILKLAEDCRGIAIGGNLSDNSQTAIAMEAVLEKANRPIALYDDALELLKHRPELLVGPRRLVVADMPELFKLAGRLGIGLKPAADPGAVAKIAVVQAIAHKTEADYLIFGRDIIATASGQVSLTNPGYVPEPAIVYGLASVFWLQNQNQPFEGLTTAGYVLSQFDDHQIYTVAQACKKIQTVLGQF